MNINNKELQDRVREVMAHYGITMAELANKMGSHQSTLSRALSKGNTFGTGLVSKMLIAFPINKNWLLNGEGEMFKIPFINEVTPVPEGDYMMVEYVDLRASAGNLGGSDIPNLPDTHKRLVPREYDNGNFLVIRVDGDSMNDGTIRSLADGDEILVKEKTADKWEELPIRKTLFVIASREGNMVKQIKQINKEKGYILCHSFNPNYEDFKIRFEDIFQIFVVCKVVNRQISLT